jgi:phospholipase C
MKQVACFLIVVLAAACGALSPPSGVPSTTTSTTSRANARTRVGSSPIQHVIVIMQENRSFDNLFYGFPGANSDKISSGPGRTHAPRPVPLAWKFELRHDHPQFLEDFDNGLGDGFSRQIRTFKTNSSNCSDPINHPVCWQLWTGKSMQQMAYAYVIQSQVQSYWTMAQEYSLGDNTFSSNSGPSFPSHQYLIAAQSGHASEVPNNQPWGCDAPPSTTVDLLAYGQANPPVFPAATGHEVPGPYPCFTYPTIANLLDTAGVTWRYYSTGRNDQGAYLLSAFDAIQAVRNGPDWQFVKDPDTTILTDIASGALPQVAWVTPTLPKSDHCGPGSSNKGPAWVASIVNAVGESSYWNSTAIIILWDEWGGWYDHVIPPQYSDPVTGAYEGLGFRVPLIVVSPYARVGYVSHQQHEIASTLHFIENTFGLPSLNLADARADAFDDIFNYSQTPTPFQPIPASPSAHYFLTHQSNEPGDTY